MNLTNQQILTLSDAITQLDGQHRIEVIDGKACQIFRSYKLDHKTRWNLARNQGKLRAAIDDFNRTKDAFLNQHSKGKGVLGPSDQEAYAAFARDFEALKQEIVEIDLLTIALDGLKLEENERAGNDIPISVLAALQPLILTE